MAASDRTGTHGRGPLSRRALAETLLTGIVIPAHPLALTAQRRLDERRQVALTRYYADAGACGVAVGVHTTQFAIRSVGLFEPVLRLAAGAADEHEQRTGRHLVRVAGAVGATPQAVAEAVLARGLGYDAVLLSLAALRDASGPELLAHCRSVAEVLPVFGFYLQPAVGGRVLDHAFWRGFLEIENVVAIKVAAFNRYQTLDVVRALATSGRAGEVALYTGNDDTIVPDLLADFVPPAPRAGSSARVRFSGGLLGQWAAWTRRAVELLEAVKDCRRNGGAGALELLALGQRLTDANGALFDVQNAFAGCIAGIGEVLRRQGLLANRLCLDPHEDLSPGQSEEIDRVTAAYPELTDDAFVAEHLDRWLR
jgi:dihydrodipicolinate synthase/N-acetylneuraminate lyase